MQAEINELKQHMALGWDHTDGLTPEKLSGLTWGKIGKLCEGIIGENGVERIAVMTKKSDSYLEIRLSFAGAPVASHEFCEHINSMVRDLVA